MNIGIITTSLTTGGSERFVITLYKILHSLGYNVHIFSINPINELTDEILNITYLGKQSFKKPFLLYKALKREKIEIIIDNRTISSFTKSIIYNFIFRKKNKIKIVHSYNIYTYFFKMRLLNIFLFKNYDKIICVSQEIKQKIEDELNLSNCHKIYNPIPELTIKHHLPLPFEYILYYGRIENKSKDLSFLIDSYAHSDLKNKGIRLLIIGNGKDRHLLMRQVKQLALQNFIIFKNAEKEPFYWVKNAKCIVMTSHYEGFPMAIVESLALGTPVVCTNFSSGPSELIKNEWNGLIVEKDIHLFANALNRISFNTKLYVTCKTNAKTSIIHLKKEQIKQEWQKILAHL